MKTLRVCFFSCALLLINLAGGAASPTLAQARFEPGPGDRWRMGLYRVERPRASADGAAFPSRNEAEGHAQYQAWSPTLRGSFHRPERFGVVEFSDGR